MWDLLQRYRSVLLIGALIVAPLVLLYAQTRAPDARGPVVGLIIDGASFVERGLLWATGGVSDVLQKYVTSVASYDELVRLRREQQSMTRLRARILELEHENEVFRGLANVAERIDGPRPLGARVIGRSGAPLTRILRIDRGSYDGIKRGDGVVTPRGVVGRVLSTGRHSSDVLLLTDPSSAVDVVSQRTRARGIVRGTGEETAYRVRIEDFDRLADVEAGDTLVTSGLGGSFPAGLVVGDVQMVALREDGLYQIADVKPAVDVARVEHVLVLVRRGAERIPRLGGTEPGDELGDGEAQADPKAKAEAQPKREAPKPEAPKPEAARTEVPKPTPPAEAPSVEAPPTGTPTPAPTPDVAPTAAPAAPAPSSPARPVEDAPKTEAPPKPDEASTSEAKPRPAGTAPAEGATP